MMKRNYDMRRIATLLICAGGALAQSLPGRSADALRPVPGSQVELGGEIGRRIHVTIENNLLAMDVDGDFLQPFRDKNREGGYIGLGKTIETAVRFAAHTGSKKLIDFKTYLVDETIQTQEPDGYIGIVKPEKRVWSLWDIHEMSYAIHGLTVDYQLFGEERSLEAARKAADYIIEAWSADPEREPGGGAITVYMAVTGSETAMLELYKETGERRYLEYCTRLRKLPEWDGPIVLGRWGQIAGHAYAYMSRCIAQLRLYRFQPDPELLTVTQKVLDFLTTDDGLAISGTCGDHECWHNTQEGTVNLGETCATAYLIRLLDERYRMEGKAFFGDMMERSVYNALFAAQSPDGRKIRYYSPFDGPRAYFDGDTYCCPCNYRRILAELPNMVYYRSERGVAVNLYAPSNAEVDLGSGLKVRLKQETDYPNTGQVLIAVEPSRSGAFPVQLRIPGWCTDASVSVNGEPIGESVESGTMFTVDREWSPGDRIRLHLPMGWRLVEGRKAQAGRAAVMRGPMVFNLNRSKHKDLAGVDLRLIVIDPDSIAGPVEDASVHEGGLACQVKAWGPGTWYPFAEPNLTLTLTEFADPGGEATYFKIPNPEDSLVVEDELVRTR